MSYSHLWDEVRRANPGHSRAYAERWVRMAAEGRDLDGEARLVDAMAGRAARILDAGCGTGRVGGYLLGRGHDVTGVDLDEVLIEVARSDHPAGRWRVGDLATADLGTGYDLVVCAGQVLTFLDPASRPAVASNLAGALAADGRLVTGFGAGRGYSFARYEEDLEAAGLAVQARFSSWDLRPFGEDSDFLVLIAARG
ncbi:class I SAM-dependent DNA methyltransferase [Brachybacterium hainanense]|uniref:Class I SAM-dependent DNA methyltransferase n=1 Tax=Brachybacterium hainanense TaxID=1541174 RepID=A0ABV6R7K9_9MICO